MQYITILFLYGMVFRIKLSYQLSAEEDLKFIYFSQYFRR